MTEIPVTISEEKAADDVVASIQADMPPQETLYDLAELFKMFGDSTRIGIICALYENELCVYDIARLLHMTQSAISHQLRLLRTAGLVRARRAGKSVFYSLDDGHVHTIFQQGLEHVTELG